MVLYLPPMEGHGTISPVKNGSALADHGARVVNDAIAAQFAVLPEQLRRSLTWDAELAQHVQLKIDTALQIYFCDPYSPWQRGTNENINGHQHSASTSDLSRWNADDLAPVTATLNGRPRKTLQWHTPAEATGSTTATVGTARPAC
jgi:IS30 family transposase